MRQVWLFDADQSVADIVTTALLFVLTSLAAYRAVRFVTVDDFPPMMWTRDGIESFLLAHIGADWADGVKCPWCAGFWVCCVVVVVVWRYASLPLPGLWFAAVPAVAGYLSTYDER